MQFNTIAYHIQNVLLNFKHLSQELYLVKKNNYNCLIHIAYYVWFIVAYNMIL